LCFREFKIFLQQLGDITLKVKKAPVGVFSIPAIG